MSDAEALATFVQKIGGASFARDAFTLRQGIDLEGRVNRGPKNALLGVHIDAPLGLQLVGSHVRFRKEVGADRFGKTIGANRELSFGDPSFDDVIYVESDVPDDVLRGLLSHAALRADIVRAIESDAFDSVAITDDGKLRFSVARDRFDRVDAIRGILARAPDMVDALVNERIDRSAYRGEEVRKREADLRTSASKRPLIGGLVALDVVAGFAAFFKMASNPLTTLGFSGTEVLILVGVFVAHSVLLFRVIGPRHDRLRTVTILTLAGAFPVLAWTNIAADEINARYDRSAPSKVAGEVMFVANTGKGGGRHVEGRINGRQMILHDWDTTRPGSVGETTFLIGKGALGAPWIVGSEIKP